MSLTTDPNDPRLTHYTGPEKPGPQAEVYLVLSESERAKGFVRPVRDSYRHVGREEQQLVNDWTRASEDAHRVRIGGCGTITTMGRALAETYARIPTFYGATYCCTCCAHFPVGEFVWTADGSVVGS